MEDQKRMNIAKHHSDHCQSEKEAYDFFINTMVQIVEKYGKSVLNELDCAA